MSAGGKGSEGKCLIQVQRIIGKREEIHLKAVLQGRQKAAYIQKREMQICSILAGMFRLVLDTLEAEAGNY